jgi:hypothetical protein
MSELVNVKLVCIAILISFAGQQEQQGANSAELGHIQELQVCEWGLEGGGDKRMGVLARAGAGVSSLLSETKMNYSCCILLHSLDTDLAV